MKDLIAEVDDDGSGEIEWEEYLIIMGKKRKDAQRKGSGLFQMMAKKAAQVAKKKEEKILQAQLVKEVELAENQILRDEAVVRAQVAKKKEKELIAIKNEEIRVAAVKRKLIVEQDLILVKQKKEQNMIAKREKAEILATKEKKAVFDQAKIKSDLTKKKASIAVKRKTQLADQEEARVIAIESKRQEQRQEKSRRADIERMFTRVQLEDLREQFNEADTDNSQSIDANELMVVCQQLGENISMNQVKDLIAEVDDDGSGEIEWEEYLIIMGKKRDQAMKKGSGLFQKMSMRANEAANRKQEQIEQAQRAKEATFAIGVVQREEAVKRAEEQKIIEQNVIVQRNIIKEQEALVRVEGVEIEKEMVIRQKAIDMQNKQMLGQHRAAEAQNQVWEKAEQKRIRTEASKYSKRRSEQM